MTKETRMKLAEELCGGLEEMRNMIASNTDKITFDDIVKVRRVFFPELSMDELIEGVPA